MNGAALVKEWRDVHPLGRAFAVSTVLIIVCALLVLSYAGYVRNEPDLNEAHRTRWSIQNGIVKPDRFGCIDIEHQPVYVTRAAGGSLIVLWPYNLAHDDNYFAGLLFSDQAPKNRQITALGPTRGGYPNAPRSFMTHLRVDHEISEHWYHVQGKMYK